MSTNPTDHTTVVLDLSNATPADFDRYQANLTAALNAMPDGPIREPGDDVPSIGDLYTDAELCAMADLHAARLAKRGMYDIATDIGLLRDALSERSEECATLVEDLERMSKLVHTLAAEKRQAQEWIANLRQTNELYSARISFLEGGK
jgi:type IV secretory pathway VirJ component